MYRQQASRLPQRTNMAANPHPIPDASLALAGKHAPLLQVQGTSRCCMVCDAAPRCIFSRPDAPRLRASLPAWLTVPKMDASCSAMAPVYAQRLDRVRRPCA